VIAASELTQEPAERPVSGDLSADSAGSNSATDKANQILADDAAARRLHRHIAAWAAGVVIAALVGAMFTWSTP
jgi:hypothetical protein